MVSYESHQSEVSSLFVIFIFGLVKFPVSLQTEFMGLF